MGYNLTKNSIEAVQPVLDQLVAAYKTHVIPAEDPATLAYAIRQAFAAARHHEVSPYDTLDYKLRVLPGAVIAQPKLPNVVAPQPGVAQTGILTVAQKMSHFEIVLYMTQHDPSEILFTNHTGDVEAVKTWANKKGYVVLSTDPLHLQRESDD